jgi:DMSO/TMAO reductase YedYZ molybdopterin-dependent catalytic subunit
MRPPPRTPFDRTVWRSPLRGPWLASLLSLGLLVLFGLGVLTGYFSYVAYEPQLEGNSVTGGGPDEGLFAWRFPTSPAWLFGLNQTVHVLAGLAAMPILLAKLWAVMPKFYKWPPATSPAQAVERLSYGLLIGSALFLLFTGVYNIAYWYPWDFNFVQAHFYSAWVFTGAFVAHIVIKLPVMRQAFRDRGVLRPLREDVAATRPEPYHPDLSAPLESDPPTLSRRGLVGLVGAASALMVAVVAGQSTGGWTRRTALLAPRGQQPDSPLSQGFQVNQTAAKARVTEEMAGPGWRLEVEGPRSYTLSRDELLALPQHTARIPIQCVEGWVSWQTWTGVRLADLAARAGAPEPAELYVESLQPQGAFNTMRHGGSRATHPDALLALRVNGEDLSLDHGFPARIMVPATPGVRQTKWVARLTWSAA